MKNKELFDRTISILVKAYQEGTLYAGSCASCAVGCLVSYNTNISTCELQQIDGMGSGDNPIRGWGAVFCTVKGRQRFSPYAYKGIAKEQIDSTGYSIYDLAKIEKAFESVGNRENDESGFNGLMSVCDALMEIHEADKETVNEARGRFVLCR